MHLTSLQLEGCCSMSKKEVEFVDFLVKCATCDGKKLVLRILLVARCKVMLRSFSHFA